MHERVGIVGSGAIATGLAATVARFGDVVLWARSEESATRARATVDKVCGRLSGEVNAARVKISTNLEDLHPCSFLVEAVKEDHAIKSDLLAELAELAPVAEQDAILSTTTSSLSVEELAKASGRPDRFVGLHVFNPVPRMPLVELVFPREASLATRERATALCHALGKTAVEVPDVPGFVVNRLLFPYLFSAVRLLEETGMDAAAVDECMKLGAGHPMGPLALLDFVGLDVSAAIGDEIGADVPERIRKLIADGKLGKKTGAGLLRY